MTSTATTTTTTTPHASASLYAGDLAADVTEAMLFEIFNSVGPVASIRVCRDAVTRRSLGYAYINFHNPTDAERALDALNFSVVRGRPIRIMWSHRDPSLRKSGAGNIFVKSLDKTIDNKTLYDTFSIFGNILSCKISTDEEGQSKGFGFVHYETEEAAHQAIEKVNGMLLGSKKVYVGPFIKRSERDPVSGEIRFTNVYVNSLPESMDDEKLRELFRPFGTVTSGVVMKDDAGKSKGFGFVNFEKYEEAKAAVEKLNGTQLDGKTVFVGRAQKKSEREAELRSRFEAARLERQQKYMGVNLYVKNLDDQIDDNKLREEFTRFGTITSAKVMKDDKGISRGFGFVCFSSPDEATKAVTEMNGKLISGKPLYVALAQRKEDRRMQLESQYAQQARMALASGMRMQPGMPAQAPMYPGQPMFYPSIPPQARQQMMGYPQQMMPRPGWRPQQMQAPRPGYTNMPYMAGPQRPQMGRQPRGVPQPGAVPAGPAMKRNIKYTSTARNREQPVMVPQPAQPVAGAEAVAPAVPAGPEPLTANALANATPAQQKEMLGERIFPLIQAEQPELAGKITGMLLEMDNSELLMLLESAEALHAKIEEAVQVLEAHGMIPQAAPEQEAVAAPAPVPTA